jgi:hypothetical protein
MQALLGVLNWIFQVYHQGGTFLYRRTGSYSETEKFETNLLQRRLGNHIPEKVYVSCFGTKVPYTASSRLNTYRQ